MKYGAIDIGTNAVLLLVLESFEQLEEILDRSTITRLGEGLTTSGRLSMQAMERTAVALEEYTQTLKEHGVSEIRCFGTSAVREAGNSSVFIEEVYQRTGLRVETFSERQEAYYTFVSVKHDPVITGRNLVIVDIGGGSTEVITGTKEKFMDYYSLPVGTVKLTERFIGHDPPLNRELENLTLFVRNRIGSVNCQRGSVMVGMAGTMTTLAAMVLGITRFNKRKVHGMKITAGMLDAWIARLAQMSVEERRVLPGMEAGREDLLLQGMILMREIMRSYRMEEFTVSAHGARYGVIHEAIGSGGSS